MNERSIGKITYICHIYINSTVLEALIHFVFIYRCPTDNTVRFHAADRRKQRFSIQAFRYFNNLTTVYIHCLVLLCQKSSSDSRCTSGCSGNNIHRAKREITGESTTNNGKKSYSEYYVLDEGPMVLSDGKGTTGNY